MIIFRDRMVRNTGTSAPRCTICRVQRQSQTMYVRTKRRGARPAFGGRRLWVMEWERGGVGGSWENEISSINQINRINIISVNLCRFVFQFPAYYAAPPTNGLFSCSSFFAISPDSGSTPLLDLSSVRGTRMRPGLQYVNHVVRPFQRRRRRSSDVREIASRRLRVPRSARRLRGSSRSRR